MSDIVDRMLDKWQHSEENCYEAAGEIKRLRDCLEKANKNHEHFEREWYLRGDEIERLREKCDRQAMILRRLTPENFPDTLFISGTLGDKDQNNMPEKLLVVPAYGVDFAYIYERTEKTTGPEW